MDIENEIEEFVQSHQKYDQCWGKMNVLDQIQAKWKTKKKRGHNNCDIFLHIVVFQYLFYLTPKTILSQMA